MAEEASAALKELHSSTECLELHDPQENDDGTTSVVRFSSAPPQSKLDSSVTPQSAWQGCLHSRLELIELHEAPATCTVKHLLETTRLANQDRRRVFVEVRSLSNFCHNFNFNLRFSKVLITSTVQQ
jgi:hypothetical protein